MLVVPSRPKTFKDPTSRKGSKYSMDKCSKPQTKQTQPTIRVSGNKYVDKPSSKLNTACDEVITYLKRKDYSFVVRDLTYAASSPSDAHLYFFDEDRQVLFIVLRKYKKVWQDIVSKKRVSKNVRLSSSCLTFYSDKLAFSRFVGQGLIGLGCKVLDLMTHSINALTIIASGKYSDQVTSWVIDFLALLVEMRDPFFFSPANFAKFMCRFFSVFLRLSSFTSSVKPPSVMTYSPFSWFSSTPSTGFQSESLDWSNFSSLDALFSILALFKIPASLLEKLKVVSLFTSKKPLDTPSFMADFCINILEIIHDSLEWVGAKLPTSLQPIISYISTPMQFIFSFKTLREMEDIIISYNKNPQRIFDPLFRERILSHASKMREDKHFLNLITGPNYKLAATMYSTFKNVLLKQASTFNTSSRTEPVCFVFEGPAGSGKSTLMLKVVEYLASLNYSVYNHTCPSVDSGKDFYDDYLNQDVFVMDDVGQQGISQWRQIINFVSPVDFPLDCASADLKNTKHFSSSIILISTNNFTKLRGFTKADCISEPDALFRRCHVISFNECKDFKGNMQYMKYDYSNVSPAWSTTHLPAFKCSLPTRVGLQNTLKAVAWVSKLILHMSKVSTDTANSHVLSPEDLTSINASIESSDFTSEALEISDVPYNYDPGFLFFVKRNFLMWKQFFFSFYNNYVDSVADSLGIDSDGVHFMIGSCCRNFVIFACINIIGKFLKYFFLKGDVTTTSDSFDKSVSDWRNAMKGQGYFHSQSLDNKLTCLKDRMRFIILTDDTGRSDMFQGLPSGRRIITQYHAYSSPVGTLKVYKDWDSAKRRVIELDNIPYKVVYENKLYDISILELPLNVPLYKSCNDILFPTPASASTFFSPFFVNCDDVVPLIGNFKKNQTSITIHNVKGKIEMDPGAGIVYPISSPGLCGSLIMDPMQGLLGMHIAGDKVEGAAFIYSEKFKQELKGMLDFKGDVLDIRPIDSSTEDFSGLRLHDVSLESKFPVTHTNLSPTELFFDLKEDAEKHGVKMPPKFDLGIGLGGKDAICAIGKKTLKPTVHIPQDELNFAEQVLELMMIDFYDVDEKRIVSGGDGLSPLNKDSVNGLGYSKDKADYIDFPAGEFTPAFRNLLESFESKAANNELQVSDLCFYEAFKDELRPLGKEIKPRSFRVAPLHHTVLLKKYMGELLVHFKNKKWEYGIGIGINPYKDWDDLYKMLKNLQNTDGDIGNYDGGLPPQVQDLVNKVLSRHYKGDHPLSFAALLESIVRTMVKMGSKLFWDTHGMPSGAWITALLNTIYNRLISAMAVYRAAKKLGRKITPYEFLTNITEVDMGDDKIGGATGPYSDIFNGLVLRDYFEFLGMPYTDAHKQPVTKPFVPIEDLTFLKRKFRYHKGLKKVVGCLDKATLYNTLRYFDSKKDYEVVMNGKLTAFQYEMYLHEEPEELQRVLRCADRCNFYYQKFDDAHISKAMSEEGTFAFVQQLQSKFYSY